MGCAMAKVQSLKLLGVVRRLPARTRLACVQSSCAKEQEDKLGSLCNKAHLSTPLCSILSGATL